MSKRSNESNVYKPKMTGFLMGAVALALLVVILLAATVMILSNSASENEPNDPPAQTTTATPDDKPAATTPPVSTDDPAVTTPPVSTDDPQVPQGPVTPTNPNRVPTKVEATEATVPVLKDAIHEGSLLLFDDTHTYQKDPALLLSRTDMGKLSADKLLSTYGFELIRGNTGNYTVAGSNRFLNAEALYYFNEMMADYAKESSNTDVQVRNAYYYSSDAGDAETMEHSTGYYIDLQIYRANGTYPFNYEPLKSEYYDWFVDNCWKYGFIHVRDTGSYSTFRFIGSAHAAYMNKNGLNLTQYLAAVTVFSYEGDRLKVTDGFGWEWWVYYVKSTADTTSIPVLGDENSYRISGNNTDGYVVAINTACFS